jgi:hypothetical protein
MRISSHSRNAERVRLNSQSKGNWMHLTIAPLVAEKLLSEDPLPGAGGKRDRLGSVVGTAGRTGLTDDDSSEPGE